VNPVVSGLVTAHPLGTAAAGHNGTTGNGTLTLSGDCWQQWNEYWNASANPSYTNVMSIYTDVTTESALSNLYTTVSANTTVYSTVTTTITDYGPQNPFLSDGSEAFPVATSTQTVTFSNVEIAGDTIEVFPGSWTTFVTTETITDQSMSAIPTPLVTPSCILPAIVPQCQSSWDAYLATGGYEPLCQQVSINSSMCSQLVDDAIVAENNMLGGNGFGRTFGNSDIPSITSGSSVWWPTHSSVAPGCTVGCQGCAIRGDTVSRITE